VIAERLWDWNRAGVIPDGRVPDAIRAVAARPARPGLIHNAYGSLSKALLGPPSCLLLYGATNEAEDYDGQNRYQGTPEEHQAYGCLSGRAHRVRTCAEPLMVRDTCRVVASTQPERDKPSERHDTAQCR